MITNGIDFFLQIMDFHSVAHTPGNAVSGLGASRRQFSRSSDQVWNLFTFNIFSRVNLAQDIPLTE